VLIEGRQSAVEETLVAFNRDFYTDVLTWNGRLSAPQTSAQTTIIVPEVTSLTEADYERLSGWVNEVECAIQIVATSSIPVFPLVQRHLFPARLYYRLNTVRLAVS
jgi:hypothetical protein